MCKISLADKTLYYSTLLYWGKCGGTYNYIVGPYYQAWGVGFNRKRLAIGPQGGL